MASVSVCVAVYRDHGPPNVASLAAGMGAALDGLDGELVVALNGVSAQQVQAPTHATLVDLKINRGVAPGWNAAARAARGDVLVFANDDLLLGKHSLARLAEALAERPDAGVVGPLGSNCDLRKPRHLEWVDPAGGAPGQLHRCDMVSGFFFATRREVFERVGGFDEYYAPCTTEELDFCTAVRMRLGLECYAVAGVDYEHEWHISSARPWRRLSHNGRKELLWRIHLRNARHFRRKWAGVV